MTVSRYGLSRKERILKRKDFLLAQEKGCRFVTDTIIVLKRLNGKDYSRIGITASRKVGKAVERNRVKRWAREAFRCIKWELEEAIDLVIIARKAALSAGMKRMREDLEEAISRLRKKNLTKRKRGE